MTGKPVDGNEEVIKSGLIATGGADVKILHCYAQFQAVLRMFSQVNALLGYPTPSFDVGSMFNGVLIHSLVQNFDKLLVAGNIETLFDLEI